MKHTLGGTARHGFSWSKLIIVAVTAAALWITSAPVGMAQNSPAQLVESNLPHGKTIANASKADLLAAVCAAVKKAPKNAPQIARAVATARPDLAKDILRTAFRCVGTGDCGLLGRVYHAVVEVVPGEASGLTNAAVEIAPDCAGSFGARTGGGEPGLGNYDQGAANVNPLPGTIAGGGGQSSVVAVCFNGVTRFFSPEGAQNFINAHPGAKVGACVVTPVTNR